MATVPVDYFRLLPTSGNTRDLLTLRENIVFDPVAWRYIRATAGSRYRTTNEYGCGLSAINYSGVSLGRHDSYLIDGSELCTFVVFFSGPGGELLGIPKGYDEMNIVLGHATFEGLDYVFYIEHEVENGVDILHVHGKLADHVEEGPVRVVYFKAA